MLKGLTDGWVGVLVRPWRFIGGGTVIDARGVHRHSFGKPEWFLRRTPRTKTARIWPSEQRRTRANYGELRRYIRDLQQSGFDVVRLRVQLHKKLAFPLITLVQVGFEDPVTSVK